LSRERQILDAAAALFYEKGFHGVGVDEIGERVGISGPALYRHFKGKDQILAELFSEAVEGLISGTATVYSDPHRDLERLIRHHVEFALNHRHLVSVFQFEEKSLVEPWRGHFRRRERHYASRWEAALAGCFPDASPENVAAAAQAALGLIHSVANWPRGARKTPELADLLYRLVAKGLSALELGDDVVSPDVEAGPTASEAPAPSEAPRAARRSRPKASPKKAA
jgi:AcrR family transcriptional regulator